MSDKKHRPLNEIERDYANVCMKAGHVAYQLYTLEKDLEMLNKEMRELNLEGAGAKAAEEKAKAVAQAESAEVQNG